MTAIPHEPSTRVLERPHWWTELFDSTQLWASMAIVVMWLAVLFVGVYGPDITANGGGVTGGGTSVPSVIVVAFFAFLGTTAVAKYGYLNERAAKD